MRHMIVLCCVLCGATPTFAYADDTKDTEQSKSGSTANEPAKDTLAKTEKQKDARPGLTISGGISLGVYEAGLNWIIMRDLRERHPNGDIAGVTGASAGNINAFLFASEWCQNTQTYDTTNVKNNWFWRTWINVGLMQLSPINIGTPSEYHKRLGIDLNSDKKYLQGTCSPGDKTTGDVFYGECEGVLSRRAFVPLFKALDAFWANTKNFRACTVPIGVTVSSVQTYKVLSNPDVDAQKYQVPMLACGGPDKGLQFKDYNSKQTCQGGVHPLKTTLNGLDEKDPVFFPNSTNQVISALDIANIVRASSAFPIAFAPVKLKGKRRMTYNTHPKPYASFFFDGGVFDNIPLTLLKAFYKDKHPNHTLAGDIYYMDPDARRTALAKRFEGKESTTTFPRGLEQAMSFVNQFIKVARLYELQTLMRQTSSQQLKAQIQTTNRFLPVYGSAYGAFGAFLTRPFREYDYYVGLYDGLHMIATRHQKKNGAKHPLKYYFDRLVNNHLKPGKNMPDNNKDAFILMNIFFECESLQSTNTTQKKHNLPKCIKRIQNKNQVIHIKNKKYQLDEAIRIVTLAQLLTINRVQQRQQDATNLISNAFSHTLACIRMKNVGTTACSHTLNHDIKQAFLAHQRLVTAKKTRTSPKFIENDRILKKIPYGTDIVQEEIKFLQDPESSFRALGVRLILRLRQFIKTTTTENIARKKQKKANTTSLQILTAGEFVVGGYYSALHGLSRDTFTAEFNLNSIPDYTSNANIAARALSWFIPDVSIYPGQRQFVDLTFPLFAMRYRDNAVVLSPGFGFGQTLGDNRTFYWDGKLEASFNHQLNAVMSLGFGVDVGYRTLNNTYINRDFLRLTLVDKLAIDAGYAYADRGPTQSNHAGFLRLTFKDIPGVFYWITRIANQ